MGFVQQGLHSAEGKADPWSTLLMQLGGKKYKTKQKKTKRKAGEEGGRADAECAALWRKCIGMQLASHINPYPPPPHFFLPPPPLLTSFQVAQASKLTKYLKVTLNS